MERFSWHGFALLWLIEVSLETPQPYRSLLVYILGEINCSNIHIHEVSYKLDRVSCLHDIYPDSI